MSIANFDHSNRHPCLIRNTLRSMKGYPWLQDKVNKLGISQAEAARRCRIDPTYFNKIIKGTREMGGQEALNIAMALDMPIEEVITGEEVGKILPYVIRKIGEELIDLKLMVTDIQEEMHSKRNKETLLKNTKPNT